MGIPPGINNPVSIYKAPTPWKINKTNQVTSNLNDLG